MDRLNLCRLHLQAVPIIRGCECVWRNGWGSSSAGSPVISADAAREINSTVDESQEGLGPHQLPEEVVSNIWPERAVALGGA